jgi:hypothetical protein
MTRPLPKVREHHFGRRSVAGKYVELGAAVIHQLEDRDREGRLERMAQESENIRKFLANLVLVLWQSDKLTAEELADLIPDYVVEEENAS